MVQLPDIGKHTEGTITMEEYWKAFEEAKDIIDIKNHCAAIDIENNDRVVLRHNNKKAERIK